MKLWGLVEFFSERRRKRIFEKTVNNVSEALTLLSEGESVVATFESKEVKFIKKGDWFEAFVAYEKGVWEPLPFRKPKPEVQHYFVGGIPVSVGMDSNEWLDAMLEAHEDAVPDPWPH